MKRLHSMKAGCIVLMLAGITAGLAADGAVSLSEALRIGMSENPSVSAASLGETSARYRINEARSWLFPGVSVSAGYTQYEEPMTVTPIHQAGKFPSLDDEIYETSIGLSLPIFSGKTLAGIDTAKAAAAEASAIRDLTRTEIMTRITGIFIMDRELDDKTALIDAHAAALRQRLREMEILFSEGRISPAEVSLLQASIDTVEADRIDLENRKTELAVNLGRLLGSAEPVRPQPLRNVEAAFNPGIEAGGLSATGPGVRRAQAGVDMAKYGKSAAVRTLWPELTGFAAYSLRSGSDRDFSGEWAAGLTLRVPLFDAARRWSSIQAAETGLAAAETRYHEAQIAETALSRISLDKIEGLRNRRGLLSRAVGRKESSVLAFRERYSEGRLALSELLAQETELLQLKLQERSLVYQGISIFIDYHNLKGTLTAGLIESVFSDNTGGIK